MRRKWDGCKSPPPLPGRTRTCATARVHVDDVSKQQEAAAALHQTRLMMLRASPFLMRIFRTVALFECSNRGSFLGVCQPSSVSHAPADVIPPPPPPPLRLPRRRTSPRTQRGH